MKIGGRSALSASCDHIIPIVHGGARDISNVQWVINRVNRGKIDLTTDEYLNAIKSIFLYKKNNHEITFLDYIDSSFKELDNISITCNYNKSCKLMAEIDHFCTSHYFQKKAGRLKGKHPNGKELEELFKSQGGICPFSGVKMILGGGEKRSLATIDHTIPVSWSC